ncbi:TPA: hypothetical protein ACIPUI_002638 [Citrobacter freundii]
MARTLQDEAIISGRYEQDAQVQDEQLCRKATGKVVMDEQGARKVAGMLRNEPGALFLQCSLFLFLFHEWYASRQRFCY